MRANREAFRAPPDRAADAARRRRARPLDHRARHGDAGAADAGADRRPEDRPRRGRAGDRAGGGRGRRADDRQHRLALHAGGDRRGGRRGRRAGSSSTGPTTASSLESFVGRAEAAGYGAIVVTVDTFIPGWKPRDLQQAWLPFLERHGRRQLLPGPGLPRRPREAARGGPRRRDRPLPRRPRQPRADLGRPRLAARADLAADPGQGHPARRRRPRGGAPRRRRDRRLQPRRPPGRRRDRLARRAAGDRRGGRRRARRSSSTAASAAAPTCSRRSRSAPTPSASAAPTSGAWRSTARRASKRC